MAVTTTTQQQQNLSDEQRAAIGNRTNLLTGYFSSLPGYNSADPWGSAGNYFGQQSTQANQNPYSYTPGQGFNSPVLNNTAQFYANELGKIQTPKVDYTAQGNTYNPVDLSQYGSNLMSNAGGPVGAATTARTDPSAAIAAARGIMSQVIGPGVLAALSSSGMGRSGAEAEITSQRGAELALPIAQQTQSEAARANELDSSNQQSANNLSAQLKQQLAQVQYLQQAQAALQAQSLQATDANQVRTINAQLASVNAQLTQQTQQLRAQFAQSGLQMGQHIADQGAAFGMANQKNQQDFLTNLLQRTPIPGGGNSTTTVDAPSNLPSQLLNLAAIAGLSGGDNLVKKAIAAGVSSVKDFVKWLGGEGFDISKISAIVDSGIPEAGVGALGALGADAGGLSPTDIPGFDWSQLGSLF